MTLSEEMIPLAVPNLSGNEAKYLQACIESTYVSSVGPFVNRFEEEVARISGAKVGVATSSGTTALHSALVAAGVRPGDLVIVPSFTFIASANAVAHCGATPWLMDVDQRSWTLDAQLLNDSLSNLTEKTSGEIRCKDSGRRISAIMPVHTLGTPAEMNGIMAAATSYGLPVIVDAAAALGATYLGKKIGNFGDLVAFSFNGNKTVTAGAGGVIVGNNEEVLKKVRHLTTTARNSPDYDHDMVGYNYRMTNLQAAIGCAQLEQLDKFVKAKRDIRAAYDLAFRNHPHMSSFPQPSWGESACWFSGLVLNESAPITVKDMVLKLRDRHIEARPFWKPIHLQRPFQSAPKTIQKVTESIWGRILTLPCSTQLSQNQQEHVIESVLDSLK